MKDNEKDITAISTMQFLSELAAATTKYYEAGPYDSEKTRIEYELALGRFKSSLSARTESPTP